MTFAEIAERERSGVYKHGVFFCKESRHPVWVRREEAEKHFRADLRLAFEHILGPLTDAQWVPIWEYVWEEGHADGYREVLGLSMDICSILKNFVTARKV